MYFLQSFNVNCKMFALLKSFILSSSPVCLWNCSRWKSTDIRMVKIMTKMCTKYNKDKKQKRPHFDWTPRNPAIGRTGPRKQVVNEGQKRRAQNVGKVLYNYITQLVNCGELSPVLVSIDITRVKVVPDLSTMNVYWSASGTSQDDETEKILRKNQGKLRHLLTTYHLLSCVPHVTFVKDKVASNSNQVEELLKIMDFGPDLKPLETRLPMQNIPPMDIQKKIEEKFHQLSYDFENNIATNSSALNGDDHPSHKTVALSDKNKDLFSFQDDMRNVTGDSYHCDTSDWNLQHNLYGIDHNEMMKNLLIKKTKSKTRSSSEYPVTNNFSSLPSTANQNESCPNYQKLAQIMKKPKVVKAKHLVEKYEREHWKEVFETEQYEDEIKIESKDVKND